MDMKQFQAWLSNYIANNPKKITGAVIGLIVGILILTIGFFKTLLLCITTLLGYYLGSRINFEEDIKKVIMKVIPDRFK